MKIFVPLIAVINTMTIFVFSAGVKISPIFADYMILQQNQKLPNCGLSVTIDLGEAEDINPKNKQNAGKRLSLWALAKNYNIEDVVYSGPMLKSMNAEGGTICLSFDNPDGGLIIKGEALKGFAIAGNDKIYYWEEAGFLEDTVAVSSDKVSNPVAVRYAWGDNPLCNLYNKTGLPAVPFNAKLP